MAEGLQREIEYADLKLISSFAMEKILVIPAFSSLFFMTK